jgi:16S rRNA (guanine527-N7)-methyltransferase
VESLHSSKQHFLTSCSDNNLVIPESRLRLLERYVSLLLTQNRNLNLISRKDEENIWTSHILHCTGLLFHRKFPSGVRVFDLGTGGGLPGVVYAIFHPELSFTLLDATRKKIDAVQSMVNELHLRNVRTVWGRAEEIGKQADYTGKFEIVVARGVAQLEKLTKWAKPLLSVEAATGSDFSSIIPVRSLVAFKGGDIEHEINTVGKRIGFRKIDVISLDYGEDKKILILTPL